MPQGAPPNGSAPGLVPEGPGPRVAGMQAKLHRWAAADPGRRFDDLFNLVHDPATLIAAFSRVAGNQGANTPGVDGVTAEYVRQQVGVPGFLDDLRAALKDGSFRPLPVREKLIPKPGGSGKLRLLGIPAIADRVVQAALKLVLEPIFEAGFVPASYGFRPRRRAQDAIAEIHFFGTRGYKPRKEQDPVLLAVRSFYFDLATWALQEPAKWAVWVAPCPVPQRELRGIARRRRQVSEEIAGRTRQRQPLLPRLVEQAEHDHALYTELLQVGQAAAPGYPFIAGGRTWIRVFSKADARREREHGRANVRLRDAGTGQVVHIDRQEERSFWEWAIVETLRHSGIRIEELLEISQLSIRHYRRPNGEVVALLVVAPSKTDRERVMPMSPELFTVIAAIIRRHTRDGALVPVVVRYDPHERKPSRRCPTSSSAPGKLVPQ